MCVYVCVCVYIYIYIYVYIYGHTNTLCDVQDMADDFKTFTKANIYIYIYIYIYTHTHTHTYIYIYMHTITLYVLCRTWLMTSRRSPRPTPQPSLLLASTCSTSTFLLKPRAVSGQSHDAKHACLCSVKQSDVSYSQERTCTVALHVCMYVLCV